MHIICWRETIEMASTSEPWNGWVQCWYSSRFEEAKPDWADGKIKIGKKTYWISRQASFTTGAYALGLEHLLKCERCRRFNGLSIKDVRKELRWVDKKWREAVGYE